MSSPVCRAEKLESSPILLESSPIKLESENPNRLKNWRNELYYFFLELSNFFELSNFHRTFFADLVARTQVPRELHTRSKRIRLDRELAQLQMYRTAFLGAKERLLVRCKRCLRIFVTSCTKFVSVRLFARDFP